MNSEMASLILMAALFVALVGLVVYIVFLRALQGAIERCAPQNRTVEPTQVWLSLIPLFNIVWQFILVSRIAETLRREFAARQTAFAAPEDDYGKGLGTAMCALSLSSIIPFVGILTGLAGTICWIVYWVRIAGYSQSLDSASAFPAPGPAWAPPPPQPQAIEPAPGSGWPILAVLILGFVATHLQGWALSLGMPALRDDLHLTAAQTGWLYSAMFMGLMAGYVLMTTVTALGGTRWGVLVSLAGATLGACASALAQNFTGLMAARVLTGIFVAGLLPAAVQAVREWFPARMRPFAIGLFLASGVLVGAVARPLHGLLPHAMGWRVPLLVAALPAAIAAALCIFLWPARTPRAPQRGVSGGAIASVVMLAVGLFLTAPVTYFLWAELSAFGERASGAMADIVFPAAGACGAIVAGAIAWAMMSAGVGAPRTRAVLLTATGALLPLGAALPLVGFAGGSPVWPLLLMALCSMAYQGWCTLLYSAVAGALPARGVAIGAAIGALMLGGGEWLTNMAGYRLFPGAPGTEGMLVVAATSALALLVVALLAWLVRQEPEPAG